jgi:acetyl-CoA acetyltransferase
LTRVPGSGFRGVRGGISLHRALERILSGEAEVAAAAASGKRPDPAVPAGATGAGEGASDRFPMAAEAEAAKRHFDRFGTTPEHLARIASKNRFHGSLNPRACHQEPIDVQGVLRDEVAIAPLTRAMCATPADGAAAVIVCSGRVVRKLGRPSPVRILASVLDDGAGPGTGRDDPASRTCRRAYEMAGLGPPDLDIAELDDVSAYGELRLTEIVGLCAEGAGGPFAWSGATTLGGKVPVNTSGGMEARGNGGSASGLAQVHEIVTQLRGNAPGRQANGVRIGLSFSGSPVRGRNGSGMAVHIFQRA